MSEGGKALELERPVQRENPGGTAWRSVRANQGVKHIPKHSERRIDRTGQAADGDNALHDYVGNWEKKAPCPNQKTWKRRLPGRRSQWVSHGIS